MKKFLVAILVVLSTCFFALGITGCKEEHVHTASEWIVDEQATCETAGRQHKECTDCKEVLENDTIEKLNHDTQWVVVKDCTEAEYGSYQQKCTDCGDYLGQEIKTTPLVYTLNDAGKSYSVTDCNVSDTNVVIQSTFNGLPVTRIGNLAFSSCRSLQSIEIPNSVTSIGDFAFFNCSSLQSIEIPNSVTSIGNSAFEDCDSLQSITIPNGVTSIGDEAFSSCRSLRSITIPNSVTSIGDEAFSFCLSLRSITIPNSVTSIGDEAFYNCSSLQSITVAEENTAYKSIDGNLYSKGGKTLIQYAIGKTATSFTIPSGVTSIGDSVFSLCDSLQSIEIPNGVTSIGSNAFSSCNSLESVTIGNGVTSIGKYAFAYCDSLQSITVAEDNTAYKSIDGNLYSKGGKTLIQYAIGKTATSFTIPSWVTSIGDFAFYNCSSLQSIEIPNSVTSIGESAFSSCDSLQYNKKDGLKYLGNSENKYLYLAGVASTNITSATIESSCKFIGDSAFSGCYSLQSIEIPNGVTSIGNWAFSDCRSLQSVTIGNSVTSIGNYAFRYCKSLQSITVAEDNTAYKSIDGNLYSKDGKTLIQYAIGKTATEFTIPSGVTSIGNYAFEDCDSLQSIEIPNSVTSIGIWAFYSCSSLQSVTIPNSVTSIGNGAFYYCDSLQSITVAEDNTAYKSIDGNLYSKDGKTLIQYAVGKTATSFTIPNSVTSIGLGAFYNCDSLQSIEIPNSVTSIGDYAFYDCDSLQSIEIPNSVTSIGGRLFTYSYSLETIYCEAESQPSGWDSDWKYNCNAEVVWGYTGE